MNNDNDMDAISTFIGTEESVHHDIVPVSERAELVKHSDAIDENVVEDYKQTRQSLKAVIEAGTDAVDKLTTVCAESESPRAYEVLATTMKTITEMNESLMNLNKTARELTGQKNANPDVVNNTAVIFNGSTEELQKFLRDSNESE